MNLSRLSFVILGVSTLFSFSNIAVSQDKHKLQGGVLDKDNNPVPSISVQVYRYSEKVGEDVTAADGTYSIEFTAGDAISILYHHTNWNPSVIHDVSGVRDNSIYKVLHRIGATSLSYLDANDLRSSLEYINHMNSTMEARSDSIMVRGMDIYEAVAKQDRQLPPLFLESIEEILKKGGQFKA